MTCMSVALIRPPCACALDCPRYYLMTIFHKRVSPMLILRHIESKFIAYDLEKTITCHHE